MCIPTARHAHKTNSARYRRQTTNMPCYTFSAHYVGYRECRHYAATDQIDDAPPNVIYNGTNIDDTLYHVATELGTQAVVAWGETPLPTGGLCNTPTRRSLAAGIRRYLAQEHARVLTNKACAALPELSYMLRALVFYLEHPPSTNAELMAVFASLTNMHCEHNCHTDSHAEYVLTCV
jgi:hypothetical protein